MVPLCIAWLFFIASGIIFNGVLKWKEYFPSILRDVLCYGKLNVKPRDSATDLNERTEPSGSIPSLLNVPKRWFTHFYVWAVVWNFTVLFYFTSTCILRASTRIPFLAEAFEFLTGLDMERKCLQMSFTQEIFDTLVVLILVCVQVSRRLYESLCVSVFSDAKMHILHYILGIYFYTALGPTALLHLHSAAVTRADQVAAMQRNHFLKTVFEFTHWYHAVALLLFTWASLHQYRCHKILASLRKKDTCEGNESTIGGVAAKATQIYRLPTRDWFQYVSSPHYTAEILIYISLLLFFIASDLRTKWWLPVAFTFFTLLLSARQMHAWYVMKFPNYPKERKVLVPGLY